MNRSLKIQYQFIKWFFIFILLEAIILIASINKEFFLFKILINYLVILSVIPFLFEKFLQGRVDPFSPLAICSAFYLLVFGMRALDILIFTPEVLQNDEKLYVQTLIYAIVGLHFFQFGYFSKLSLLFTKGTKRIPDNWSMPKFKLLLIGYAFLSLIAFLVMIKLSGGFSYYFRNIQHAMVNITTGSALIFMAVLLVEIPILIWFYLILKGEKISVSFILFLIFVLFLFVSLGERGHLVGLVMSLLACYHYLKKRLSVLQLSAVATFLLLFLVLYGQYREFTAKGFKVKKAGFAIELGTITTYQSFMNNFDQMIRVKDIVKYVPEKLNFQYGKSFFNLLLKPIPSRIWEDKPQGAGNIVTKHLYPKHFAANASVAPSLLGELYLNFHVIGVILGMFLFGILCKGLYLLFKMNFDNKNLFIFYIFILPYIFNELRGDFAVVSSFLIFNLILLIIALSFITTNRKRYLEL